MMTSLKRKILTAVAAVLLLAICDASAADKTFPRKPVELIVPSTPGGGADQLLRTIQSILQKNKIVESPVVVINKPGGGGMVAAKHLIKQRGDGHHILFVNNMIFLAELYGRTGKGWHYADMLTPLAVVMTEWSCLVAHSNSKYNTVIDLMEALKKDPKAVTFGVSTHGSDHHLAIVLAAKKFGIDPRQLKVVAYHGTAQLIPALLGGHVDVVSQSPSHFLPYLRSGEARYLVVASEEKPKDELSGVPTWKELGYDIVVSHWRGVVGPPDMSAEATAWWDKTLAKLVKTPHWAQLLKRLGVENYYKDAYTTKKIWAREFQEYKELVESLGLAKR